MLDQYQGCIVGLAGSISGAYNGVQAIPKASRQNVEDAERLRRLGTQLFEARP